MLGELYLPSGLALETARAVLEVDDPWAVNLAWGCTNGCLYCYGPKVGRQSREEWMKVRLPKKSPVELVRKQLRCMLEPKGIFLCFDTDPFLREIQVFPEKTDDFIYMLTRDYGIKVATLSKLATSGISGTRAGMSIVSFEDEFWQKYEPNTTPPTARSLDLWTRKKEFGDYVWVSMEPYPPSAIFKQDLGDVLRELKFVDLIVFGKWNYDSRARTEEAQREYAADIVILRDFCKRHGIMVHVKSDTIKFAMPYLERFLKAEGKLWKPTIISARRVLS